jgi:hypothetical protein
LFSRLSTSKSSESLELYPEWVPDEDEPESTDAEDGEEMEDEGEEDESDVSILN